MTVPDENRIAEETARLAAGRASRRSEVVGRMRGQLVPLLGATIVLTFVIFALFPDFIAPHNPNELNVPDKLLPPSSDHILGTDEVGRDLFSRVIHGTRLSLGTALAVILTSAAFGTVVGLVSGFVGGLIDDLIMRVVDVFLSFPIYILAMAVAAVLGRGTGSLIVALSIVWWPGYARMVRGMVLGLKRRLHVENARSLGASSPYIMRRHIFPYMIRQLEIRVSQDMGYALIAVASLSFIGLGAQPPASEWGLLLSGARAYVVNAWWYPFFPGLAIAALTLGLGTVGDFLADSVVDPEKARRGH